MAEWVALQRYVEGGAIAVIGGKTSIDMCVLSENRAAAGGGGIAIHAAEEDAAGLAVSILRTAFVSNAATNATMRWFT